MDRRAGPSPRTNATSKVRSRPGVGEAVGEHEVQPSPFPQGPGAVRHSLTTMAAVAFTRGPAAWLRLPCDAAAVEPVRPRRAHRPWHRRTAVPLQGASPAAASAGLRSAAARRRRAALTRPRPTAGDNGPGVPRVRCSSRLIGVALVALAGLVIASLVAQPSQVAYQSTTTIEVPPPDTDPPPLPDPDTYERGRGVDHCQRVLPPDDAGPGALRTASRSMCHGRRAAAGGALRGSDGVPGPGLAAAGHGRRTS